MASLVCDGLELGETLSVSAYSTVYRATRTRDGLSLVVKLFIPSDETRKKHRRNAANLTRRTYDNEHEIATILHVAQACHGIFPTYVGAGQFDATTPALVMEYIPFPTLAHLMNTRGVQPHERALRPWEAIAVIYQLIGAVGFLLKHGIAHRDIKADNIMIDPATQSIRLIDFGLALRLTHGDKTVVNTYVGTPLYSAPEVIAASGNYYNVIVADIWSCGIILLEMLDGVQPYAHATTIEVLGAMQFDYQPSGWHPATVACLLQKMLVRDPYHRARLDQVTEAAAFVMAMLNPDWTRSDD